MLSSKGLKDIVTSARPIIERQIDDAEQIAAFRDVVANAGGDWSALKALIKAQIQDERDESGKGKRVKKILDKAGFSTDYADMLGWAIMNEKNFSAEEDHDPITGEFLDDDVTIIDERDQRGNRLTVTVDSRVAAILNTPSDAPHTSVSTVTPPQVTVKEEVSDGLLQNSPETASDTDPNEDRPESSPAPVVPSPATGGDHVTALDHATEGAPLVSISAPHKPLRPLCRHPGEELCGGYGSTHCNDCLKIAGLR